MHHEPAVQVIPDLSPYFELYCVRAKASKSGCEDNKFERRKAPISAPIIESSEDNVPIFRIEGFVHRTGDAYRKLPLKPLFDSELVWERSEETIASLNVRAKRPLSAS